MGVCKHVANNIKPSNCFLSIEDESLLSHLALCDVAAESSTYIYTYFSLLKIFTERSLEINTNFVFFFFLFKKPLLERINIKITTSPTIEDSAKTVITQ